MLLENSAKIDAVCNDGCSALMYASCQGWVDIIETLYEAGADLNIKDGDGDTACTVAADKKTAALCKSLAAKQKKNNKKAAKISQKEEKKQDAKDDTKDDSKDEVASLAKDMDAVTMD